MTTSTPLPSAKIIPFPTGGRKTFAAHRDVADAADATTSRLSGDTVGGAWYHEAAIQDAKRAGER